MADNRGHLLPVYVLADESGSMGYYVQELNAGLESLCETLAAEPMIAAKVRLCVIGFASSVAVRLPLSDLRTTGALPQLNTGGSTNYQAAFQDLLSRIPADVSALKRDGYLIHRPAVFFLSDGQPDNGGWLRPHQLLTNRTSTPAAPNIIACGVGSQIQKQTIRQVATQEAFAFVSVTGADIGVSIARFFTALTSSVVQSGQSLNSASPQLVVEPPDGFCLAIDVV